MACNLPNSFVDVLVVVGIDDSTGLKAAHEQSTDDQDDDSTLFNTPFQPELLAAISEDIAVFPQEEIQVDLSYPPKDIPRIMGLKRSRRNERSRSGRVSRVASLSMKQRSRVTDLFRNTVTEWPLSSEMIGCLSTLCFPNGVFASEKRKDDQVHYLVRTNMDGDQSFICCLTTYIPAAAIPVQARQAEQKDGVTSWFLQLDIEEEDLKPSQNLCYVPQCITLISKHPYFNTMKECLSRLIHSIRYRFDKNLKKNKVMLYKECALQLTMTPVPPPGLLLVEFIYQGKAICLHPPEFPQKPPVDVNSCLVLVCLTTDDIIKIICAMLTQRRIVFVSKHYTLLTIIAETFRNAILPFEWHFPYVPVLADVMLEFLQAPGAYIMGCHADHLMQLRGMEDIVLVDLDQGRVFVDGEAELPPFPVRHADWFSTTVAGMQPHFSVASCTRPSFGTLEDAQEAEREFNLEFNKKFFTCCLKLMVKLYRDVLLFIKGQNQFFDQEGFLEYQDEEDRPFYKQAMQATMFREQFLPDRCAVKRDYWAVVEEESRDIVTRPSVAHFQEMQAMSKKVSPPRKVSTLYSMNKEEMPEYHVWHLPKFQPDTCQQYYAKCISDLDGQLQGADNASVRAACLLLRGMLHVASRSIMTGMDDFHSLLAHDERLFPKRLVSTLLSKMSNEELEDFRTSHVYKKEKVWTKLAQGHRSSVWDKPVILQLDKIPRKSVGKSDFEEHIKLLDITKDTDTIQRLFKALTLNRKVVDPATFEIFYQCWKEIELESLTMHNQDMGLEGGEYVLKVTGVVKTTLGMGRIALSQKRFE